MYKIIQNGKVIDVVRWPVFIRFLPTGHIAITDKSSAQGIAGSDNGTVYSFAPTIRQDISIVTIEEITQEEFNRLYCLLNSGQEVSADESALARAKASAIKRLSSACKSKITSGFSIELSDGKTYSFKLTTEDQLNLMSLEGQLNMGAESFIYHATDLPCMLFSREDMVKVLKAFKRCTLYHTTYFNAAKHYINSLTDIEKVNAFTYGMDISSSVENLAIKHLLKNGGERL